MPIVVNFVYIFSAISVEKGLIYTIKKSQQKKFGKSKISYYDVIRQILQFA